MSVRTAHRSVQAPTGRVLWIALATAALIGLLLSPASDQGFFAIVFLGPVLTGIGAGLFDRQWKMAASPWALLGVYMLLSDWLLYDEDVVVHAVLTPLMVGLVALSSLLGRAIGSRRSSRSHR